MIVGVAVVVALLVLGAPTLAALAVALGVVLPWQLVAAATAVIVGLIWIQRRANRRDVIDEAAMLRDLSAAVAAGATLRTAISSGASPAIGASPRRRAIAGAPMTDVAASLRLQLTTVGDEVEALARFSDEATIGMAAALATLADHAETGAQAQRDRRVAVAQSRFSAIVVGIVPLVVGLGVAILRGVPESGGPWVVLPMVAGVVLMGIGSIVVLTSTRMRATSRGTST